MARTIAQIKQQLLDAKNAQAKLSTLNSPSQVSYWNLWLFVQAVAISFFEQILDLYKLALEAIAAAAPVGTPIWVKARVLLFQYDASNPQILGFDTTTFTVSYPVVDATKKIITQCSVLTDNNRIVNIKVAKSSPPQALSAPELSALTSYCNVFKFAGVENEVISLPPDQVKIGARVYYDGQYSAVIQAAVITALNNYLAGIPFDGAIKVSGIEDAIQAVLGVNDVIIDDIVARDDATPYGGGTILVQSSQVLIRIYNTVAGYIVGETTAGQTFADTITLIAT